MTTPQNNKEPLPWCIALLPATRLRALGRGMHSERGAAVSVACGRRSRPNDSRPATNARLSIAPSAKCLGVRSQYRRDEAHCPTAQSALGKAAKFTPPPTQHLRLTIGICRSSVSAKRAEAAEGVCKSGTVMDERGSPGRLPRSRSDLVTAPISQPSTIPTAAKDRNSRHLRTTGYFNKRRWGAVS